MGIPLAVFAQLVLTNERGEAILVQADGDVIEVKFPTLWIIVPIYRHYRRRIQRQHVLNGLHRRLQYSDLTLEIRVPSRSIARLRPQSRSNRWSRLLGLGAVELDVKAILLSLLQGGR
jgi:hypothetical protein